MYGDCQVMQQSSSPTIMGGLGVGSSEDGNMGMPMPIPMMNMNITMQSLGNPNHLSNSFMSGMPSFHTFSSIIPKEEMGMMRNDEQELDPSGSGSGQIDGLSCGEEHDNIDQQRQQGQDQNQPQLLDSNGKKKRYHRHTARQIQEMEALFKECPHPDDKQRLRLSQELGLKPRQVKFWFQNRRTQMKAQQDRSDNVMMRAENENLKNENYRLQAAIRNVSCPNCGGPAILGEMSFDEQHLRLENARLKEELERLSCITARFGGRLIPPVGPTPPSLHLPSLDLDMGMYSRHFNNQGPDMLHQDMSNGQQQYYVFVGEEEKGVALELAVSAAEQLVRMCRMNEPLWVRNGEGVAEVMDLEEYGRMFPAWPMSSKQLQGKEVRVEASRDSGHVMMNSVTLVNTMLNVDKWVELFPTIVANARTLQFVSTGLDNGSGSLQLMYGELQVLSPLVPTRDCYFFRYCQQNIEEGFWTVVDFPCDGLMQDGLNTTSSGYRRKPSGFIFQDMPNGYSMVTWVEQAELEDKATHQIFDQFVRHGFAFGATRWLSVLQHQCYRIATLMARNVADLGVIPTLEARKNLMVLSQRMIRTYCVNIISSSVSAQPWTVLSDSMNDTIRIITRKNTEPGQPNGGIMTAVLTAWLPFTHQEVFELLTDERRRLQLDVVSGGNSRHEVAHIANGPHRKNCVSLFRISASGNSSHNVELMLQESSTHPTGGSLIVHSNIEIDAVQLAMSGKDPSYIPLLPTGYVILPAASPTVTDSSSPLGSLLTIGLQVFTSAVGSTKLNLPSLTAIDNHLCNAISQITSALASDAYPNNSTLAAAVPDQ